jgi:hypothetical protein
VIGIIVGKTTLSSSEKDFAYIDETTVLVVSAIKDTKGVIRRRKWEMTRQYNGQKQKDKKTNNNLQNTTQKTKDLKKILLILTRLLY